MTDTNEDIARAAGLDWPVRNGVLLAIRPDWPNDPGAVATWLLPVLEGRFDAVSFDFCCHDKEMRWSTNCVNDLIASAPTWHEAVINGILATREDK